MLKRIQAIAITIALTTLTGNAATNLLSVTFETDTTGQQPVADGAIARPDTGNLPDNFVEVVDGVDNPLGTGKGVELYDYNLAANIGLEYNFVDSLTEGQSLIRGDFSLSFKEGNQGTTNYISAGFGEYATARTLGAKANRWNEMRLYDTGTISFADASGGSSVLPTNSSHDVSMFVNDLPDTVFYIGLDGSTNELSGDSIHYWLDGVKTIVSSLDIDNVGTNGTIGTTTNNFGKFGFTSSTAKYGSDYVFDDFSFSTFDTVYVPVAPDETIFNEDYETQLVGNQPVGTLVRPNPNPQADKFTIITNGAANTAGSGNGVQFYDDNLSSVGAALGYNIVGSTAENVSTLKVEFDIGYVSINTNATEKWFKFGVGQYYSEDDLHLNSDSRRWIRVQWSNHGRFNLKNNNSSTNYPDSDTFQLDPGSNKMTLFLNDYDSQAVDYEGPDGNVYSLPANSGAFWTNNAIVLMSDGSASTELHLDGAITLGDPGRTATGDTIADSENNIGRIGWYSGSSEIAINYSIDNVKVWTNLTTVIDSYEKWLVKYPGTGTQTNYYDDVEPDGLDNLSEFALGGDPTVDDAATVAPTFHLSDVGGTTYLNYVYNRRDNADVIVLTYDVNAGADLVVGLPSPTEELSPVGTGELGFEIVTNRIPTTGSDEGFMQLDITLSD